MPGYGAVLDLGRSLADQDLRGDMSPRLLTRPCPRHTQCPAGAQAGDQIPFERATALDVQRLIDRLVDIRIASSSGYSIGSLLAICCGLQPCTQPRSPRCGLFRPFQAGPCPTRVRAGSGGHDGSQGWLPQGRFVPN